MDKTWAFMVFLAGYCTAIAAPPMLSPSADIQGKGKITAQAGIDVLLKSCPGLDRYGEDLKSSGAKPQKASLTDQRDLGWVSTVEIDLLVADRPQRIPTEYKASGHHCYFDVAPSGKNAGVTVSKRPCVSICQGEVERSSLSSGYKFFPAP